MIYLNLTINNPFSDKFEHVRAWANHVFKHIAWEVEIFRSDTIAEIELKFTVMQDHAGVTIGLGLLSYTLRAQFYDTRHWNYEEKRWRVYTEEDGYK